MLANILTLISLKYQFLHLTTGHCDFFFHFNVIVFILLGDHRGGAWWLATQITTPRCQARSPLHSHWAVSRIKLSFHYETCGWGVANMVVGISKSKFSNLDTIS